MGLVTVSDVSAYTGTSYDSDQTAVMNSIIEAVSDYIEFFCDTKFTSDVYSERISIIDNQFSLKNNLQYFYGVFVGVTDAIEITPPSINCSIKIGEEGDTLSLISTFTKTDIDISAQKLSETVTSIGNEAGWTASLKSGVNDYYSKTLFAGTWKANVNDSNKIVLQCANDMYDASQFAKNVFQTGVECAEGTAIYQGGYATIPDDLADATIRFCIKAYNTRNISTASGNIKSERVGDYAYTIMTASEEEGGLTGVAVQYYDVLLRYRIKDI